MADFALPHSTTAFEAARHGTVVAANDVLPAKKDLSIETLRGVAITLMVLSHVVGDDSTRGLHVDDDSLLRYLCFSTQHLRMPLFTVISGFVYAMRPVAWSSAHRFMQGKARRLLLPLLTVATVQYLFQNATPGANHHGSFGDVWRIYVFSYDQFWFLQALFSVFLLTVFLEGYELLSTEIRWLGCLTGAALISHFTPGTDVFSLGGFLYLLPYFLLGCGLQRYHDLFLRRPVLLGAGALLFCGVLVQQAAWFLGMSISLAQTSWLGMCIGMGGAVILFAIHPSSTTLARLGNYSFVIYLFHVFATGGSRIILQQCGISHVVVLLAAGLALGLCLPIVVEHIVARYPLLGALLLGRRVATNKPSAALRVPVAKPE
jgi:fucose 4-O-acetylase-like acetyltransferase